MRNLFKNNNKFDKQSIKIYLKFIQKIKINSPTSALAHFLTFFIFPVVLLLMFLIYFLAIT